MRWRTYGDVGILVELEGPQQVVSWCAALEQSTIPAQARPGWSTVLVTSSLSNRLLVDELETLAPEPQSSRPERSLSIDVSYTGEDLDSVAQHTGLTTREVIQLHTQVEYTVVFLGFSRGFPYLSGLDRRLWLPRRDSPRARVPAGSVAIAASQTGVYPQESPGGWHLIGRTNAVLFDPNQQPPSLVQPGDLIRFIES